MEAGPGVPPVVSHPAGKQTTPRCDAGLVADKQQRLVLYGGEGANSETLKDIHVFSIMDGEWFSVYCRTGSVMVIHFGFGLTRIHEVD